MRRYAREGHARAGRNLGHFQALADRDEGARGPVVEIEERVLAERLDQADGQLGVAPVADPRAHVFRPDAEREE